MARKAGTAVNMNPLDQVTPERLDLGARVITSIGIGILAIGFMKATGVGVEKEPLTQDEKKAAKKLVNRVRIANKNLLKLATTPIWKWKQARDALDKELAKENPKNLEILNAAVTVAEHELEPFADAMDYLTYGLALTLAGLSMWFLGHPDVVKEAIKAAKDVAVRIVDEISEAGEALAKIIDEMMPSILELIGITG